ncbi:MAG: type II toxin-antitoxin system VapC family toxin [Fibrobacteria bacterium]|nr:type II toxin-antitoxin system VapC family toxin [Fibrobacteria bacterium]
MLLLDTCTLLWLAADQKKLSPKAAKAIKKSPQLLFVSAISAFEIAIKSKNGKLSLPLSPQEWFSQALEFHGINELPVTGTIAVSSVELPSLHNDPCDRIIIATALENDMRILTSDKLIKEYPQAKIIW